MAITRKFIECECKELFTEGKDNQLEGEVIASPWKIKANRVRQTKSASGSDILVGHFQRSIICGKCKQELLRENRQYEVTPPVIPNDESVSSYFNRDFIMKSGETKSETE